MQSNFIENLQPKLYGSMIIEDFLRRLFFEELKSENLDDFICLLDELEPKFKEHKFITEFLKCKDDENLLNETRYEFNTLFVGPRRPKALPYESVYFDYKTMFGSKTMEVRAVYESIGLKVENAKFDKFPDDYIGYELQALYFMSYNALKKIDENSDDDATNILITKRDFINSHPAGWFKKFGENCALSARLDIWKSFSEFLNLYLQEEIKNLLVVPQCDTDSKL